MLQPSFGMGLCDFQFLLYNESKLHIHKEIKCEFGFKQCIDYHVIGFCENVFNAIMQQGESPINNKCIHLLLSVATPPVV